MKRLRLKKYYKKDRSEDAMYNISNSDAAYMVKHPNKKANEIGQRVPYYLQYRREQKTKQEQEAEQKNEYEKRSIEE